MASRSRARRRDQSVTIAAPAKGAALSRPGAHGTPGVAARVETSIRYAWRAVQRRDSDRPDGASPRKAWRRALLYSLPPGFSRREVQIEALVL